jgi:hypothetical protein
MKGRKCPSPTPQIPKQLPIHSITYSPTPPHSFVAGNSTSLLIFDSKTLSETAKITTSLTPSHVHLYVLMLASSPPLISPVSFKFLMSRNVVVSVVFDLTLVLLGLFIILVMISFILFLVAMTLLLSIGM